MSEVSRTDLELLALDELPADRAAELRARIDRDPDLGERFARVAAQIARARPLPPLPALEDDVVPFPGPAADSAGGGRRSWWVPAAVGALALAAALILAIRPRPEPDSVAFRGALDVAVVRVRGPSATPVGPEVAARAGDRLQYTLIADQAGYVSVFDVQEDGVVSAWLDGRPVDAGRAVTGAAILDDYAGLERVVFVWSADAPLAPARFEAAVAASRGAPFAGLDRFPGLDEVVQRSILVREDP